MKQGFRVLDSDIHVLEPADLWVKYIDAEFRDRAPTAPTGRPHVSWELEGRVFPAYADRPERQRALGIRYRPERMQRQRAAMPSLDPSGGARVTEPDAMLQAMDQEGIDVAVPFRTYGAHVLANDDLDPRLAAAICRAFNRWLRDFCQADPQRLKASALVPLHDVDLAVAEARYAVGRLGAVTLVLPSQPVIRRPLYDRYYDPLWAAAEEMNVAVSFHGIQTAYSDHLATRYLDNHALGHAVGQPVELMLALGAVLTGGILARFPRLRMAFLEGNCGWLPWWLWALDERWEAWGDRELFQQEAKPSELFLRQCFVSIEPEERVGRHAIADLGDENIVISTDWPHDDSRFPHAIDQFLAMEELTPESKRKILWDNCARLYNVA